MKKFLSVLLALTMLLLLVGCKKSEASGEKQVQKPVFEETDEEKSLMFTDAEEPAENEPAEEITEETEEAPIEEATEEEAPVEEDAPSEETSEDVPAEEPANIEMGSWDGFTFENLTLGYGVALDEGWHPYTDEEILAMNNRTIDQFDSEAIKRQLANSDMFCDMAAQKLDSTGFVQVNVENLGVVYGTILSVDDYIDICLTNLEPALVSAGYTIESMEKVFVTVDGTDVPAIYISGVFSGINIYQVMVPVKTGDRVACICASTYLTDTTSAILDCIYLIP